MLADAEVIAPRRGRAGLLPKQLDGIRDRRSKIIIYRGGYRSGKTAFLVAKALDLAWRNWPHPVLAVEPSFPMIRSVFVATALHLCGLWKLAVTWQESKKVLTIGTRRPVKIWCRSADSPRSLEGLTVSALIGDEWELWDVEALKVAMARVSIGPCQQIVLGGTPEGFGPGYKLLEEKPKEGTRVIVVRTRDNPMVRADYEADMRSRFSDEEATEKLDGERCVPSGRVYTRFDAALHCAGVCLRPEHSRLEVWCDFNEAFMCWLFVLIDDHAKAFHVIGELIGENTDSQRQSAAAVRWIATWYSKHRREVTTSQVREMKIKAVCDARGDGRSEETPLSHVVNLKEAGFAPLYGAENPAHADRVASVQKVLADVRLTLDPQAAPYAVRCLAQQPKMPDGRPSKELGHGLGFGSKVIGCGVMWHSPAFRPSTAYEEEARARAWDHTRRAPPTKNANQVKASIPDLLANRMLKALGRGERAAGSAVHDLGCSIPEFIEHIEKQFLPGMSWENHGVDGWQLDHIRPLSSVDLTNREQFLKVASFRNYQPLWAKDNAAKGNKWNG